MSAALRQRVEDFFSADGPLAAALPNFTPREQQLRMAVAVAVAIEQRQRLVVEAGTGTGKTLAYLIPALLSGVKVLVSTASRTLQSQLYDQVLPFLRAELGLPVQAVQLKGRGNYLCLHRLESSLLQESQRRDARQLARLQTVQRWSRQTRSGDLAELGDVGDGDRFWNRVSSTAENCLGQDCEHYTDCYLFKARKAAMDAELVIVNHHLLLADYALREEGFAALLPGADLVIADEAHHLPEIANQFFGQRVSSQQLGESLRDLEEEGKRTLADVTGLEPLRRAASAALVSAMSGLIGPPQRMNRASLLAQNDAVATLLPQLMDAWLELELALHKLAARGKEITKLAERLTSQRSALQQWLDADSDSIAWAERQPRRFDLNLTPQDLSGRLQSIWDATEAAWIFTSATLAVGENFDYFNQRMGLAPDQSVQMQSPFAYDRQSLLYLPGNLPLPSDASYLDAVFHAALPLIEAAGGGAFILCTSMRAVKYLHERLQPVCKQQLLAQGDAARGELLRRFREDGNAILVATQSFWEGVDVRGSALRLVIIDKLPFAAPDEPVLKARGEYLKQHGGNPFKQLHLPRAVLALKQGAGRLIRDSSDRGVLMIADPRLQSARYASQFLDSLPPMRRCSDLQQAIDFMASVGTEVAA